MHEKNSNNFPGAGYGLDSPFKLTKVREYVWEQVKDVNFAVYDEIVFLSKSIGSVEAGILAERLGIKAIR